MSRNSGRGFTLVEMLVVITIIGILAAMAIPNFVKARDKAKEAECRSNLHDIQTMVERFNTDWGQYPPYIAGGTQTSWTVFHRDAVAVDPDLQYLSDPLIEKGYVTSYPTNPFLDRDAGIELHKATDFGTSGDPDNPLGDPRFGEQGWTMANMLDDPRFWDISRNPTEPELRFFNSRGAPTGVKLPYDKGGKMNGTKVMKDYISGEFFYRATGEFDLQMSNPTAGTANVWEFRVTRYDNYIMGVYGAQQNKGLDMIRLNGTGNYFREPDSNFDYDVVLALPEVMGGGSIADLPTFPYKNKDGNFIYGAPDGVEDGIIIAFSGSGWKMTK